MAVREKKFSMESVQLPESYMIYGKGKLDEMADPGLSAVERLMNEFEAHEGEEGEFIQRYKEISEGSKNPMIKFLLQLIISDEEKHHAVIHSMASTLKGSLNWTRPEDSLHGVGELENDEKELLKLTRDFIQHEKGAIKGLKKLIKPSQGYYHGLFSLLLQSIIHDSEKHVKILEFLNQRLKEA